ncbi:DUF1735 domain-containing protein [Limnovirga soli]|uniref:DUF1735 domain-containing protein n=1 Tax=Limnovirga soli TaxID=2656915 RepID=A0A8J8FGY0_9BACT|nr:DUF1735 domain-containing protein [Limnovirga soli]NNV57870.1 DUF1735 domain-containing protein [Limnovirga soli]
MKKLFFVLPVFLLVVASCKKSSSSTSPATSTTYVQIPFSGLNYFNNATLNFVEDTLKLQFSVNVVSVFALSDSLVVKVAVNDTKRTNYNDSNTLQYEALPSDAYILSATSATIPAGASSIEFYIQFIEAKIDPSKNYMLPITLTEAGTKTISPDLNTIYYHFIGNELSGTYDLTGTRKNYNGEVNYVEGTGGTGILDSTNDLSAYSPKALLPINKTLAYLDYSNSGALGWKYKITFDTLTHTISTIEPNDILAASIAPGSFVVHAKDYNSAEHTMHFITEYKNTLGFGRLVEESFTKK